MRIGLVFGTQKSEKLYPDHKDKGTLYIETDGASVRTRQTNSDAASCKENKLGLVFSSDNIKYWTNKKGEQEHLILKREYTTYIGKVEDFQKLLFDCAIRNGYGKYEKTVILSDGATWIRNMKLSLFPDAQQILGFYHLAEHISDYYKKVYDDDLEKAKVSTKIICDVFKKSNYQDFLDGLKNEKRRKLKDAATELHTYLSNNIENIDYKSYLEEGFFIGSGAIESGNKIVLQQRLCGAGKRWNIDAARKILAIMAKVKSGLWESFVVPLVVGHIGFNFFSD